MNNFSKLLIVAIVSLLAIAFCPTSNPELTPVMASGITEMSAFGACTDTAMENCNDKAAALKRNCEFRNEGGTTEYTSCRCQSIRSAEACYRNAGCTIGADLFRSISPECFFPVPSFSDECGLEFDGGFTNSCDCNPDDPNCTSPLLYDVKGDDYSMTSVPEGVLFDIRADGRKRQTSWTAPDSDDAWLFLDRNGNGVVDDVKELFGDLTPQPNSPRKNGFLALAEFDKAENLMALPGNGDGVISAADTVFVRLRLWRDKNHNGESEQDELYKLPELSIPSLSLSYHERRRRDKHGNVYRYFNGDMCDVFVIHER